MVKVTSILSLCASLLLPLTSLTFGLPHCSQKHVTSTFELNNQINVESFLESLRLIQTSEDKSPVWMTENEIMELKRSDINFMDVTDYLELGTYYKPASKREYPVNPSYSEEVQPFLGNLTTEYMKNNLKEFTSFTNRYYRSPHGLRSSNWLFEQISNLIKEEGDESILSVQKFSHSWDQNSIVARFEGSDSSKSNEVVIVGAHQDSINMWFPKYGRAPGADDDGSGTVTILEAFRVLVSGGFKPQRPVEFHWYSAEEAGLLGSQAISLEYEKQGREVIGMIQNDMTGYVGKSAEHFGVINDYVDPGLTSFVTKLVDNYSDLSYRLTKCGYACSDHASWYKAGFPSAFVIEGDFSDSNPYIHSPNDVIDHLSFDHMLQFSKLSVSFAVELSHI
uniref:Leucine aminopeptidase 1 n=1 Tax=Anthurium amnicola TaxID=1678845 RepID=A0A1D1XTY5_9ARAE